MLDIDKEELKSEAFVDLVNGALQPEGSDTFAMCYAGHQFGFFVERLGDGRAINIGTLNGSAYATKRCRADQVLTFR